MVRTPFITVPVRTAAAEPGVAPGTALHTLALSGGVDREYHIIAVDDEGGHAFDRSLAEQALFTGGVHDLGRGPVEPAIRSEARHDGHVIKGERVPLYQFPYREVRA